ncbi:MAG: hypothetical protein HWN67_08655 [Candidatus Helarchaeota archaeon]|nr:hypothetical protein [Candidatus Helarchaeota archaeon]
MDNNIWEDSDNVISDKALRVFSNFGTSGYLTNNTHYRFGLNGGVRLYSAHSQENRLISTFTSNISRKLPYNIVLGINGLLFYDKYKEGIRDNNSYLGEGFVNIPKGITDICDIDVYYQYFRTEYEKYNSFDFSESRYLLSFRRNINSRTILSIFTRLGTRNYKRKAFQKKENDSIDYKNEVQHDLSGEIGLNLQYFRKFLIQALLLHRNNNSNSYGFSFTEKKFSIIFGRKIFNDYMLKLYFDIESKRYKDHGEFFIVIDINEDKEQDNRGIIEISKDISENIAFEIRLEWCKNESRIRKLYYTKFLLSSGLLYKF